MERSGCFGAGSRPKPTITLCNGTDANRSSGSGQAPRRIGIASGGSRPVPAIPLAVPDVPAAPIDPHYLYRLGPAIRPSQEVRTGNIFRNGRVGAHLDLLLTATTIAEARDQSKARE